MFKNAATKIAHNSTLPGLAVGSNKDLRPLQDLITAEKAVLISLQRLSVDFTKAAEALRIWGLGEGDDLGDTLSASTTLLEVLADAFTQYASHEHTIRDTMKAVRTREEGLDELKRRRKTVIAKADAAEKKLNKMSPEHKNLVMQTNLLNQLRDEIRVMDGDIMSEEAAISDFKRSAARKWMGLKFGGLLQCCEKGTILSEYGKLIIAEIPENVTEPGMPRQMYTNHSQVDRLLNEARRNTDEVQLSTVPSAEPREPRRYEVPYPPALDSPIPRAVTSSGWPVPQQPNPDIGVSLGFTNESSFLSTPQGLGTGQFFDSSDTPGPSAISENPQHPVEGPDEFGLGGNAQTTNTYSGLPPPSGVPQGSGGRFATFPVNSKDREKGYSLRDDGPVSGSLLGKQNTVPEESFSSSVDRALRSSQISSRGMDDPAPAYEYQPPSGPPPGAARPVLDRKLDDYDIDPSMIIGPEGAHLPASNDIRRSTTDSDSIGLAYDDDDHRTSKHVRFGLVSDVDRETGKSAAQSQIPEPARTSSRRVSPPTFNSEEEERALNAAAAREVSRELDALNFNPPPPPSPGASSSEHPPSMFSDRPQRNRQNSYGSAVSPVQREPSPLRPPAPPFARRAVSPQPSVETGSSAYPGFTHHPTTSYSSTYGQQQLNSPVAEFPMSTSPKEPRSTIPAPQPPSLNLPGRSHSPSPSLSGPPSRTSPEYPRGLGPSPFNKSSSSLITTNSQGPRTISAAAFRRNPARLASSENPTNVPVADTSPLNVKKSLPSSPYPSQRTQSGGSPLPPAASIGRDPAQPPPMDQASHYSAGPHNHNGAGDEDDHYDYLSAYTNPDPPPPINTINNSGSPIQADFGSLGNVRVANGGYADGRFSTNLEEGLK